MNDLRLKKIGEELRVIAGVMLYREISSLAASMAIYESKEEGEGAVSPYVKNLAALTAIDEGEIRRVLATLCRRQDAP
jgi:hypothetical protein